MSNLLKCYNPAENMRWCRRLIGKYSIDIPRFIEEVISNKSVIDNISIPDTVKTVLIYSDFNTELGNYYNTHCWSKDDSSDMCDAYDLCQKVITIASIELIDSFPVIDKNCYRFFVND